MFSSLCKNFHVNKQRKNFKHWLLYDTTVDPFILFLKLEDFWEVETFVYCILYFYKQQKKVIERQKKFVEKINEKKYPLKSIYLPQISIFILSMIIYIILI